MASGKHSADSNKFSFGNFFSKNSNNTNDYEKDNFKNEDYNINDYKVNNYNNTDDYIQQNTINIQNNNYNEVVENDYDETDNEDYEKEYFTNNLGRYNSRYNDYYDDDYDEEGLSSKKKTIIAVVILVAILIIGIIFLFGGNSEDTTNTLDSQNQLSANTMIEQYNGYNVLGQIKIDEFNVEQYILDSTEDEALDNGVIRLYGGSLNNYGNLCLAGHNKENVFGRLAEMEVGDTFTIVEKDLEETKYKITQIYTAEPDDLKCLLQDDEKIEITLITCENASTSRLIVKAEEI